MEIQKIRDIFEDEFSAHKQKFEFIHLVGAEIRKKQDQRIWRSGVYVFWKEGEVLRVGMGLNNVYPRALSHLKANTGGIMGELDGDPTLHLLLFTVAKREDEHWIFALEDFLEWKLEPKIPSERRG